MFRSCSGLRNLIALFLCCACGAFARDPKSKWIRISSAHFAILTDAGEKNGKEAILRLEQMRAAFAELLLKPKPIMPEPLDVIAFPTRIEYAQTAPISGGQPISTSGFFLPGEDRNYIALDLSDEESWRPTSRQFALFFLRYNYPPTQAWFDEGFAQYFSSLHLNDTQEQIGGDPSSFVELLSARPWLPFAALFGERDDSTNRSEAHRTLFEAESWMVMHYLLNQHKLPETGAYFGLVENQKLPVEQAIQQAYGVTAVQFEQSVNSYFHSIAPQLQAPAATEKPGAVSADAAPIHQFLAPVGPDEVGTSYVEVPIPEAEALVAEMAARVPEHREQVAKELDNLVDQPETESAIAHRVLGWVDLQDHEYPEALEELGKALDLNPNDPWTRYYLALVRYRAAQSSGGELEGVANMMLNLRSVLDWNPDFAEAYNMLAMAQLEGGGLHAASDTMHAAIQLNPRSQTYLLNLAHIFIAQKKWDEATALLDRLKDSEDSQVATTARGDLADLPTLRKYGILPQRKVAPTLKPSGDANSGEATAEEHTAPAPAEIAPDRRKVQFLQGKLMNVDCSQPPAATLKVAAGAQIMRLRTGDYKSLLLIGAGEFSCEWKSVSVVVNYKVSGKGMGDLVSLELR
jgi:tetratricopeptide (TPR) repeat protein